MAWYRRKVPDIDLRTPETTSRDLQTYVGATYSPCLKTTIISPPGRFTPHPNPHSHPQNTTCLIPKPTDFAKQLPPEGSPVVLFLLGVPHPHVPPPGPVPRPPQVRPFLPTRNQHLGISRTSPWNRPSSTTALMQSIQRPIGQNMKLRWPTTHLGLNHRTASATTHLC